MSLKEKLSINTTRLNTLEQNLDRMKAKSTDKVLLINKKGFELFYGPRKDLKGKQKQVTVKSINKSFKSTTSSYVVMDDDMQNKEQFRNVEVTTANKTTKEFTNDGIDKGRIHVVKPKTMAQKVNETSKHKEKVPQRTLTFVKSDMKQKDFVSLAKSGKLLRVAFSRVHEDDTLESRDYKVTQAIVDTPNERLLKGLTTLEWNKGINQSSLRGSKIRLFEYNNGLRIVRVKFDGGALAYYLVPKDMKLAKPEPKVVSKATSRYNQSKNTTRFNTLKRIITSKTTKSRTVLQKVYYKGDELHFTDSYQAYILKTPDFIPNIPKSLIHGSDVNYPELNNIFNGAKRGNIINIKSNTLIEKSKNPFRIDKFNTSNKFIKIEDATFDVEYLKNVIKLLGITVNSDVTVYYKGINSTLLIKNDVGSMAIILPIRYGS